MKKIAVQKGMLLGTAESAANLARVSGEAAVLFPGNKVQQDIYTQHYTKGDPNRAMAFAEISQKTIGGNQVTDPNMLRMVYAEEQALMDKVKDGKLTPDEARIARGFFYQRNGFDEFAGFAESEAAARKERVSAAINEFGFQDIDKLRADYMILNNGALIDEKDKEGFINYIVMKDGPPKPGHRASLEKLWSIEETLESFSSEIRMNQRLFEELGSPIDSVTPQGIAMNMLSKGIEESKATGRSELFAEGVTVAKQEVSLRQLRAAIDGIADTPPGLMPGRIVPHNALALLNKRYNTGEVGSEEYKELAKVYSDWDESLLQDSKNAASAKKIRSRHKAPERKSTLSPQELNRSSIDELVLHAMALNYMTPEQRAKAAPDVDKMMQDRLGLAPGAWATFATMADDMNERISEMDALVLERSALNAETGLSSIKMTSGGADKLERAFAHAYNVADNVVPKIPVKIGDRTVYMDEDEFKENMSTINAQYRSDRQFDNSVKNSANTRRASYDRMAIDLLKSQNEDEVGYTPTPDEIRALSSRLSSVGKEQGNPSGDQVLSSAQINAMYGEGSNSVPDGKEWTLNADRIPVEVKYGRNSRGRNAKKE